MCGRYTLIRLADFTDMFPWIRLPDSPPPPRFNVAPSQAIAVVPNQPEPKIDFFSWGLVPSWAKDPAIGNRMINARAETLAEKPAFRTALWKRRRCLIPADGFYEWRKSPDGKSKTPMYIRMKDGRPFAFAGLWETWRDDAGTTMPSCTIVTVKPNELMKTIHDRMPAILRPEDYRKWLDPGEVDAAEAMKLLGPYPDKEMEAYPVSKLVNSPKNESADCIKAVTEGVSDEEATKQPRKPKAHRRKKADDAPGGLFPE